MIVPARAPVPAMVSDAAAAAREARDPQGVPVRQSHDRARVDETAHGRTGEDVATGRPDVPFGGVDTKRRVEPDPRHQRAEIARGGLLRRAAQRVLHVVAGEDDEVGPGGQPRA